LLDRNYEFVLCNTRYREARIAMNDILVPGTPFETIVRASVERGIVDIGDVSLEDWVSMRLRKPTSLRRTTEQLMTNGRWVMVSDYITRDDGRLIVTADVTGRKRVEIALRASEERNRLILETVLDGIVAIDENGLIQSFNAAAERIFGYSAGEVEGRNVSILMPEPYRGEHDGYLRNYLTTGKARIIGIGREVEGMRKDGSVFSMELSVGKIPHGDKPVFVGVVRDISERKKAESDILHARFEAETSNRAKSQFLANMSHELRTPLNAILGFSETISSEIFGPLVNDKYRDYVESIQRSGQHLLTLINDILDLSKIEAGAFVLDLEDTDIHRLIQSSLSFVSTQAQDRDVSIKTDIADAIPPYNLDRRRIKQVLLNLLSNALKFGKDGGVILIRAYRDDATGDLVVTVRDDGIGMAPEEITLALMEFGQVQSAREHSHAQEGTGLGLPLSRNLVAAHGGTLVIESEKGAGTTVIIRLPATVGGA
ncbi:MAG: PAS domain S-box protein, partial [Paracoccaceae bacterium]|nr:PAS domain S-box protein [Paracoccaceae bacterium]